MLRSKSPASSKSKSTNKKSLRVATAALTTTLTITKESLDGVPIPGLKAAVGGLLEIIKAAKKTQDNAQDLIEMDAHVKDLSDVLQSITDNNKTELSPDLRKRITKLTGDIEKIVESCGHIRSQPSVIRFFTHQDDADAICGINRSIDRALQAFQLGGTMSIEQGITRLERRLERLAFPQDPNDPLNILRPHISDARYDSSSRTTMTRCFEGTRSELLHNIFEWADDASAKSIYWLCGLAGTGKSTIAQTVAEGFNRRGVLGASFFFSRDVAERSNPLLVLPTLAYQLARFHKSFSSRISTSVSENPEACNSMLQKQMEKLIAEPLCDVIDGPPTVVLVIDALDECTNEPLVQEMLVLLATTIPNLPFRTRVFITSRPDVHIRSKFHEPAMKSVSEASLLHDIDISVVQHDIGLYLGHHLRKVGEEMLGDKAWLSQTDIDILTEKAKGFFIYASALITFLGDKEHRQPKQRLSVLLTEQSIDEESPYAEIDKLYRYILQASLPRVGSWGLVKKLQPILGTVVLLLDPLPARAIEKLMAVDEGSVRPMLTPLHSILSVPDDAEDPIRVFHQSFPDFMIDSRRCTDPRLYIEPGIHHARLALWCINVMNTELRRNICDIQDPFILNEDITDLAILLEEKVGPHLVYACRFWASHLQHADHTDQAIHDSLSVFVTTKMIYWLEILSLSQNLDSALVALKRAQEWYQEEEPKRLAVLRKMMPVSKKFGGLERQLRSVEKKLKDTNTPVKSLLYDCQRMVHRFYEPILTSASHIYNSALPFIPRCLLYKHYEDLARSSVKVLARQDDWDPALAILQGHDGPVQCVCFSPSGSQIASCSEDSTIRLWDPTTGACTRILEEHSGPVQSVCFSPDGLRIASGSGDNTICIWDSVTGTCIKILEGHSDSVESVCFSPDGSKIASGSDDKTISLWDSTTGTCIKTLEGHLYSVQSVCFSPDGSRIASGSADDTVRLWDSTTGICIKTLKGHSDSVTSVCFSPDGSHIVSGADDTTVRLWDSTTGASIRTLEGNNNPVRSVCFSSDGSQVASGSQDDQVHVWDSATGTLTMTLDGHSYEVNSVCFSPDGSQIVSGSYDQTVRLWDSTNRIYINSQEGHAGSAVWCLCASLNGLYAASGSADYTVSLWDFTTGAYIKTLDKHSASIQSVCFSSDGSRIASGSNDQTVCIWDTTTGTCKKTLTGHSDVVRSVCFSPWGSQIVSSSDDCTVCLWNSTTGDCVRTLEGHSDSVCSVSFSPDGSKIASGSDDHTVRLWESTTGVCINTLEGHLEAIWTVCFSPDGSLVASGSADFTVRLWDPATGAQIKTLEGHSNSVLSVRFSPDGSYLRSYCNSGEEIVWHSHTFRSEDDDEEDDDNDEEGGDEDAKNDEEEDEDKDDNEEEEDGKEDGEEDGEEDEDEETEDTDQQEDRSMINIDGAQVCFQRDGQTIGFYSSTGTFHHVCSLPIPDIAHHVFFNNSVVLGTTGGKVHFLDFSPVLSLIH